MARIFISYRRKSSAFTLLLANKLSQQLEADIFVDFESIDQVDFETSILKHLHESDVFLLMVTEHTFADRIHMDGDWVRKEIRIALERDIPIVLVSENGLYPPANLPDDIWEIRNKQGIEFYPAYFDAAVTRLVRFLVKATNVPLKAVSPTPSPDDSQQLPVPKNHIEDVVVKQEEVTSANGRKILEDAVTAYHSKDYAQALFLFEALQDIDYQTRVIDINETMVKVNELHEREERKRLAQYDYDEIALFARSPSTLPEALTFFEQWAKENDEFVEELDTENLLDKLREQKQTQQAQPSSNVARIFISYSRADTNFVERFLPLAKRLFPDHQFFYDDDITAGEDWWQRILAEIAKADLFIYLLSNDSLESEYCQAEFREAQRLRKAVLPVIVRRLQLHRAPDDIQSEIRRLNWVDMQKGFNVDAYTRLQSSIRQHLLNISASVDVPAPISPEPISEPVVRDKKDSQITAAYIGGGFLLVSVIIAGIFGLWQGVFANNQSDDAPTQVVQEPTATDTPAMTNTPFDPVIASVTAIFQTSEAVNQLTQAALAPTETELALQIAATETQEANFLIMTNVAGSLTPPSPTPTWTPSLTPTHTPDLPATATRQVILGITATQQANLDATATQLIILNATATVNAIFQVAETGVTSNAEWENLVGDSGYVREFDGIEIVLVPAGCFVIGSDNEDV
ncbi:MAG: toll/interleukin-1 receptor domain-containing protein, partial [Chloroflexota bacterium]